MKKISYELRTTALFKCVITFKNGVHKIMHVYVHMVATIVAGFRKCQKSIFKDERLAIQVNDEFLILSDIKTCKFINERTGQELLTIA